jgi:type I restriction enzyme R subunit
MCVSSVDVLTKYYEAFKSKNHNLKIATIFSYSANEDDKDANGIYELDESDEAHINQHSRDKLESYIENYNKQFGSRYTTKDSQSFYNYYNDISKRVKNRDIDLLLVVNMFLTGFDSPSLNTLYVDKNLKYHGLIQAYSRTNRILGEKKSQGNIVCFRNLKVATDDAIALFSNKEAKDIILMNSYDWYVGVFNNDTKKLFELTPLVGSVDSLPDEEAKAQFVVAFRALMRTKNILDGFSDFKWSDLDMTEQNYEDFKSKYLDIKDSIGTGGEGGNNILNSNPQLRSKKELIEAFIDTSLEGVNPDDIEDKYDKFVEVEKEKALTQLIDNEKLHKEVVVSVVDTYLYDGRKPLNDDIAKTLQVKPKLLERKKVIPRILDSIIGFVDKFYDR